MLGISRSASEQEIKSAYRKLALQFHPDRNPGNAEAEEKFKEASEAYSVLSDQQKRSSYDRFGHAAVNNGGGMGFDPSAFQGFEDIFGDLFGEMFGGGGRGRRARAHRGADLRVDLELEFREAVFGTKKEVQLRRHDACDTCDGSGIAPGKSPVSCSACGGRGQVRYQQGFFTVARTCGKCAGSGQIVTDPCKTCNGVGRVAKEHTKEIVVPAGVEDGTRIRYQGDGEAGAFGGPAGDLYAVLHVQEDEFFERDGFDLHCEVPITFPQATLGTEVMIPTLEGEHKLKIPAGTQSGDKLQLRGKGVPVLQARGRGTIVVHVKVEVPTKLSKKQREILEQLSDVTEVEGKAGRKSLLHKVKDMFQ